MQGPVNGRAPKVERKRGGEQKGHGKINIRGPRPGPVKRSCFLAAYFGVKKLTDKMNPEDRLCERKARDSMFIGNPGIKI